MSENMIAQAHVRAQVPHVAATPAAVRDELLARALRTDATRLWLADAASIAVQWSEEHGRHVPRGPTHADVDALARAAGAVPSRERDEALALLRSVAR